MEQLNDKEIRILGCLMEKEKTTPDAYPLTVNSLLNACNQKTGREPVMQLDNQDMETALDSLCRKGLAARTQADTGYAKRLPSLPGQGVGAFRPAAGHYGRSHAQGRPDPG